MDFSAMLSCERCPLAKTRKNVVVGRGSLKAEVMFIGEAPGAKEDETGLPFVGKAGKNLSSFLKKAGIDESKIYIANILKCRPPGNRNPKREEIEVCTPWLVEQIRAINPQVICTLGNYATRFILSNGSTERMKDISGISELHGKEVEMELFGKQRLIFPLYHPAALIYNRNLIPEMERDLEALAGLLFRKATKNAENWSLS